MAANTELFLPLCFAQCFTVRDKSRDFAELLAEVVQADMGIVLGDVLIGVAHHALDGQLIGAGLMQAAREGMAAQWGVAPTAPICSMRAAKRTRNTWVETA